jgi:hypothetical protein
VHHDLRPRLGGQLPGGRDVVRLDMRLEHIGDVCAGGLGHAKVVSYMVNVWVDDRQHAFAQSAKDVAGAAGLRIENLPKDHECCSFASLLRTAVPLAAVPSVLTGRPAAAQSG